MQAPFDISSLPTKPGCYLYSDIAGDIIYIGKAKNLRKRVNQYFAKDHDDIKTTQLVEHIKSVDFIITPSEIEALLLESRLIKQHKPKYNIDLKYGVRYAWIVLTNERFPRLLTVRKQGVDGEYFGPFVNGTGRRMLVDILQKKFFIRTCRVLPKKECLRYHIGICKAPCVGKQNHKEYMKQVEQVRSYLRGDNNDLISELEAEMKTFSDNLQFELAKQRKEQIDALEFVQERIVVENSRLDEEDVITYQPFTRKGEEMVRVLVFSFRRGVLVDKEEFTVAPEEELLDEFVKRYYEVAKPPKTILVQHELVDEEIDDYLATVAGHKVEVVVPKRGLKKDMLDLATSNMEAKLDEDELLAREIMEKLELDAPVRTIECFDISHLQGTNMVAAMTHFKDGKPVKSKYRKFKIKTLDQIDDFRAMHEVVTRRYKRVISEQGTGSAEKVGKASFPDLIVIDGGAIQLEFAKKALDELGVQIPIVGLAKNFEEIYFVERSEPVRFDKKTRMMKTFIAIRDEAHRFGITYHRLLRSKKAKL